MENVLFTLLRNTAIQKSPKYFWSTVQQQTFEVEIDKRRWNYASKLLLRRLIVVTLIDSTSF
jgi:hypothetical protein